MKLAGIVVKSKSQKAKNAAGTLVSYLESKAIGNFTITTKETAFSEELQKKISQSDLCVTFGGDGTLLYAARIFSPHGVPIVGVNMGRLGFITEFGEADLIECMECVINEKNKYEERIMVDVEVKSEPCPLIHSSTGMVC